MASPQLENGYTRIANELLEALSKAPLPGSELRLTLAIFRYTYGMQKKSAEIKTQTLINTTGFIRQRLYEAKKNLMKKNILLITQKRYRSAPTYCINKNYEKWICNEKPDKERKSVHSVTQKRSSEGFIPIICKEKIKEKNTAPLVKDVPEKQKNGKRQIPPDFKITDDMAAWFNNQNFRFIDIETATAEFVDYWKSEGKQKKDWVATWRNGMRNKEKWARRDTGKDDNDDAFKRFLHKHQADDNLV